MNQALEWQEKALELIPAQTSFDSNDIKTSVSVALIQPPTSETVLPVLFTELHQLKHVCNTVHLGTTAFLRSFYTTDSGTSLARHLILFSPQERANTIYLVYNPVLYCLRDKHEP